MKYIHTLHLGSLTAVLALVVTMLPAMAQGTRNCAPRDIVLQRLSEAFGETRQAIGLGAQGAVVEVFASRTSGSWSITITVPSGMTCLVASGIAFERFNEIGAPEGDAL